MLTSVEHPFQLVPGMFEENCYREFQRIVIKSMSVIAKILLNN